MGVASRMQSLVLNGDGDNQHGAKVVGAAIRGAPEEPTGKLVLWVGDVRRRGALGKQAAKVRNAHRRG